MFIIYARMVNNENIIFIQIQFELIWNSAFLFNNSVSSPSLGWAWLSSAQACLLYLCLKGLYHNHTIYYHKMLLCILIHMDAMIILYSTYVFENFHFLQIPEVNPYLKTRFPDEKMIMKISFQTENFAQNWLPDVIFW